VPAWAWFALGWLVVFAVVAILLVCIAVELHGDDEFDDDWP